MDDRGCISALAPLTFSIGKRRRCRDKFGVRLGMLDKIESCVSAEVVDWTRETPTAFWDPGRKLLRTIRRYQHWRSRRGPLAAALRKWLVLRHRFWSAVTGADIPLTC